MRITKRSTRFAALAVGIAFIAASCGSDDDSGSEATTGGTTGGTTAPAPETTAAAAPETTAGGAETTAAASDGAAMTVTIEHQPGRGLGRWFADHVADFNVLERDLNTPGSLTTAGYDKITSIEAGRLRQAGRHQVLRGVRPVQGPVRATADAQGRCGGRLQRRLGRVRRQHPVLRRCRTRSSRGASTSSSWCRTTPTSVPNPAKVDKVVMVPKADSDTEIASLVSGESPTSSSRRPMPVSPTPSRIRTSSRLLATAPTTKVCTSSRTRLALPTRPARAHSRTTTSAMRSPSRSTAT